MATRVYNVVCYGDLYRFYVGDDGEVMAVHFYAFMGTQYQDMEYDNVPQEVKDKFESQYVS